jgi:hypothetical protein
MRELAQKPNRNPERIRSGRSQFADARTAAALRTPPVFGHDFSRIPVHPPAPAVQQKLAVNQPGDEYEQEADRVAGQVMRMAEPTCSCSGSCTKCRATSGYAPPIVHEVLHSPGRPLDHAARAYFEPRMGYDFTDVRVRTGPQADAAARSLSARAFTLGRDIVFADGEYATGSDRGRSLLAHELTHVVQQSMPGSGVRTLVQRACLPESDCAAPPGQQRPGSAGQFGAQQQQLEAPKQAGKRQQTAAVAQATGHGKRAVEVEKIFQKYLPNLRPLIHGVFVDETLSSDAGARRQNCLAFAQQALPPDADLTPFQGAQHACVFIPAKLEQDAATYNHLTEAQQNRPRVRSLLDWEFLRALTHESTHERVEGERIAFPASPTCSESAVKKEISELAACISEFPFLQNQPSADREAWGKTYLTDPRKLAHPGESIFGSIREMRCSCECGDADSLIREAFRIGAANWTDDQRFDFHVYMKRGKGQQFGVYWPFEVPPRVGKVGSHELSLEAGLGSTGSTQLKVAFLAYHYVLSQWSRGRFRLRAGAEVNPVPLFDSSLKTPGEFGAGVLGLQFVSTPQAAEKTFGGFTARLDTGLGVGNFLVTPASADLKGDYILEVGAGVRFFIPRLRTMIPASLEAAYRYTKPQGSDARSIQTFGLSVSFSIP